MATQHEFRERLTRWLADHDERIERFRVPVSLSTVAKETGLATDEIKRHLQGTREPYYHVWAHQHGKKLTRSKPYCLRLNGPTTVGLDWEYSVVGAVEAEFRRRGFQTCQELGAKEDLAHIIEKRDLDELSPGINQRDLWALRRKEDAIDVWIVEAKGKEAAEFAHYCFAEVFGQVFEVSGEVLTALLGSTKSTSHGLCCKMANRLRQAWEGQGLKPTITLAVLVPNWRPDVVWKSSAVRLIKDSFYVRPLASAFEFLENGRSLALSGRFKYEKAFGRMLEDLQGAYDLRRLFKANDGLRFRVLTTRASVDTGEFEVTGLD